MEIGRNGLALSPQGLAHEDISAVIVVVSVLLRSFAYFPTCIMINIPKTQKLLSNMYNNLTKVTFEGTLALDVDDATTDYLNTLYEARDAIGKALLYLDLFGGADYE